MFYIYNSIVFEEKQGDYVCLIYLNHAHPEIRYFFRCKCFQLKTFIIHIHFRIFFNVIIIIMIFFLMKWKVSGLCYHLSFEVNTNVCIQRGNKAACLILWLHARWGAQFLILKCNIFMRGQFGAPIYWSCTATFGTDHSQFNDIGIISTPPAPRPLFFDGNWIKRWPNKVI